VGLSTIEGIVLAISAAGSTVAAIVSIWITNRVKKSTKKLEEVHVLVNDRLDAALERIERLQEQIRGSNGDPTA
jgi:hypothetical protein